MLADTILKLGGNPKYLTYGKNNQPQNWTPNYINYQTALNIILLTNIQSEKAAIQQYREHIREIDNEQIGELLTRIIMDEELHLDTLSELYRRHCIKTTFL